MPSLRACVQKQSSRILGFFLLLLLVVCLAFAQIIVAFSQWYGWDLHWLNRFYELSCRISLFCELGFVKYFSLALLAVILAAVLFTVMTWPERRSPLNELAVTPPHVQKAPVSLYIYPVLLLAVGLAISIVWFCFQRQLPPASLWALALIVCSFAVGLWEKAQGTRGFMHVSDWLYIFAFYAVVSGCAFLGGGLLMNAGLAWTLGLAALFLSLKSAHGIDNVWLWDQRTKIVLLLLGLVSFALGAYGLNSWRYAAIGDEWGFYSYAVQILRGMVHQPLLTGLGKYGMHPLLSSYIHAASMRLWGVSNYGWRVSNILLTSWAALSLYMAVRLISSQRLGLLAVGFYAVSHYLISFGKIGYNNLQAFWPLLTSFSLFALSLRRGSVFGMWLAGVVSGLGFYVFALARFGIVACAGILLIYCPPTSRRRLLYWGALLGGAILTALPILVEPGTSDVMLKQTIFRSLVANTPEGLWRQFRGNFLRALFSFLTSNKNSHFVFGAHLDPLSSSYMILGIATAVMARGPANMSRLLLLAYLLGAVVLGGLTQYDYPPNTRMFMLVPIYAILAAIGCDRMSFALARLMPRLRLNSLLPAASILVALPLNYYIAFHVYIERRPLTQECLLIHMLQDMERKEQTRMPVYILRPPGDHYDFIEPLLTAYGLQGVRLAVLTDEDMLRVFRTASCGSGQTIFLIPSQIGDPESLLNAAAVCQSTKFARLLDPSGAYHYTQIISPVQVPSGVGYRLQQWWP